MRTRMRWTFSVIVCVVALAAVPYADVWDVQSDNDNGSGADNELIHGSDQVHDLGVLVGPTADEDCTRSA
jgi:hypothetical protein